MIPGACPDCGLVRPLPDFLRDAEGRAALAAALECPAGLARRIVPYLALHAPPSRAIQSGKLTRLLRELAEVLASGEVTRRGDTLPAPHALWERAFDEVLAAQAAGTLSLPLDGHGYLLEVAWRMAAREGAAGARGVAGGTGHASHQPADPTLLAPRPRRERPAPPPAPVAPEHHLPLEPRSEAPRALKDILAQMRQAAPDPAAPAPAAGPDPGDE